MPTCGYKPKHFTTFIVELGFPHGKETLFQGQGHRGTPSFYNKYVFFFVYPNNIHNNKLLLTTSLPVLS